MQLFFCQPCSAPSNPRDLFLPGSEQHFQTHQTPDLCGHTYVATFQTRSWPGSPCSQIGHKCEVRLVVDSLPHGTFHDVSTTR